MDPFKASVAAARLLKNNRVVTGSWPLAMTAYNHGAAGMRRAARKLGTSDIVTVVRRYRSRTFGFASRNFYVAFLAAIDVHYNAEKYFGTLERDQPVETQIVKIPAHVTVATLSRTLAIDRATLRAHNLALRPAVWNGNKYVPRGYELRIPSNLASGSAEVALAAIAPKDRYHKQKRDRFYKVRRGNTLAGIAARFGVSVDDLMAANNLRSRHRIRIGQVLRLPGPDTKSKITLASARPPAGVRLSTPADGLYTVRSGDMLALIAGRFAIDEQQLVRLNQLSNKHRIYAGQVLRLTESAVASVEPAASAASQATAEVETGAGSQGVSESTEVTMAGIDTVFVTKLIQAYKLGTSDIVTVVRRYRSRTFGFASRNFYVAFLAAIDVHYNAEKYFGTLERDQPVETQIVKIPAHVTVATLSRTLAIDRATLRAHNLALRPAVWNGNKYVPRGYELRIPSNLASGSAEVALAAIAPKDRYHKQKRDRFYKVRRGNTLAGIAARFGVSVDDLMAANNLRSRHRIRIGQVLRSSMAIHAFYRPSVSAY